jgi:hypothetical protein
MSLSRSGAVGCAVSRRSASASAASKLWRAMAPSVVRGGGGLAAASAPAPPTAEGGGAEGRDEALRSHPEATIQVPIKRKTRQ